MIIMNNNTNYIFLLLKERNDEYEYSHHSVHELPDSKTKTAEHFSENYAKEFYGGDSETGDAGYYFYNGEIFVEVASWSFINEGTFNILNKYL